METIGKIWMDPLIHKVQFKRLILMVTLSDIEKAQQAWSEGIVAISSAYSSGKDYVERARIHVEELYAYGISTVLFKPTFAAKDQFRSTFEEALSYFVAENGVCPEDKGFAIKNWTNVRFENEGYVTNETTAMAMGNYFFSNSEGEEVKVEFSFGYIVDSEGFLRINLHHSSIPSNKG